MDDARCTNEEAWKNVMIATRRLRAWERFSTCSSLFGRVGWERVDGVRVPILPKWLAEQAKEHGYILIDADLFNDWYIFEVAPVVPKLLPSFFEENDRGR